MVDFPQTTLAIDYGTKRIGMALSHASLVEPLEVIHWNERTLETVLSEIAQKVATLGVKQLVVGISEGEMAEKSKAFGELLAQQTQLPISYVDETLTSQVVEQKIRSLKKKRRSVAIDSFAAAEILEAYLDSLDS